MPHEVAFSSHPGLLAGINASAGLSDTEQRRLINQRLMEMQVPIRGGQVHFREVLLHITRHLMGLSADDPITKSATKSLEVETAALVRRGGSLRDEYVGIVTRAKSVGKSHAGAAVQAASPRGLGSDGPVYATNQLVAAQRIQRRWVQVRNLRNVVPCEAAPAHWFADLL